MKVRVIRPCDSIVVAGKEFEVSNGVVEVSDELGREMLRRFPDHYAPLEEEPEGKVRLEEIKEVD